MNVTLLPLPTLAPATPLTQAKAAFSFAVHSCVQHLYKDGTTEPPKAELDQPKERPIPTMITRLLVGCRRKAVLYTWKDGEAQDVKVR